MNTYDNILGVWHRPNSSERETNLDELCTLLDEFKEAGINTVFLETYFHGMAVVKTDLITAFSGDLHGIVFGIKFDFAFFQRDAEACHPGSEDVEVIF